MITQIQDREEKSRIAERQEFLDNFLKEIEKVGD